MSLKSPKPSFNSCWSKAYLKACDAQSILIKPDLTSENTWEKDGKLGMNTLNIRLGWDFYQDLLHSVDILLLFFLVLDICLSSAPLQIGMKMI